MKVNPVGKKFFEVDLAYLAGFIDADGAITAIIEKHHEKKFKFRVRMFLQITQRDREILDFFVKKYKIGLVRKNRTTYDWLVRDQQIIKEILEILLPYLKVKRKQAVIALKILNKKIIRFNDLIITAKLADTLSKFNVRSLNRRKNFSSMIQKDFSSND